MTVHSSSLKVEMSKKHRVAFFPAAWATGCPVFGAEGVQRHVFIARLSAERTEDPFELFPEKLLAHALLDVVRLAEGKGISHGDLHEHKTCQRPRAQMETDEGDRKSA